MAGESQVGDEEAIDEVVGRLTAMKSRRATLRRQITMANKQIESLINVRGFTRSRSRTFVSR